MNYLSFIGLGSNLNNPIEQVSSALEALKRLPESHVKSASSLYRTEPLGPAGQDDYINAAACVITGLAPLALLRALQAIETDHDRVRDGERWGPRTLDLDLLVYSDQVIDIVDLIVPHPELHKRAFVLVPLAEIAPDLEIPGQEGCVADLLKHVGDEGIARLESV